MVAGWRLHLYESQCLNYVIFVKCYFSNKMEPAVETGFSSFSQANFDELLIRLQGEIPKLPRQEARLAQYVTLNQSSLGLETGKTLAEKAGVPEVTVGACCVAWGAMA